MPGAESYLDRAEKEFNELESRFDAGPGIPSTDSDTFKNASEAIKYHLSFAADADRAETRDYLTQRQQAVGEQLKDLGDGTVPENPDGLPEEKKQAYHGLKRELVYLQTLKEGL